MRSTPEFRTRHRFTPLDAANPTVALTFARERTRMRLFAQLVFEPAVTVRVFGGPMLPSGGEGGNNLMKASKRRRLFPAAFTAAGLVALALVPVSRERDGS
jgi:hypothetical protein